MGQNQARHREVTKNFRFQTCIELSINGRLYKVTSDTPADTSLNTFIRDHAGLKGTKFMCLEGGCGACIVSVQIVHPCSGQIRSYSVNSCLVPVFTCHGWSVTTVEGLGCKSSGYHEIQKRLVAASGTQCGYCSPGMVMNMHSLLEQNSNITMSDIENSFGGNICRCTGYRPILDGFKSLASDAPGILVNRLRNVEELHFPKPTEPICNGSACGNKCGAIVTPPPPPKTSVYLGLENGQNWYRPTSVKEVFEIIDMIGDCSYRFVCGNTGQGVYRIAEPQQALIDLNGVPELLSSSLGAEGVILGANMSLTEAMEHLHKTAEENPTEYAYCSKLAEHIDLIANVPVRNVGSIAGNLSLKYQHPEFPSDMFLLLETVGATLTLGCVNGVQDTLGPTDYLRTDMNRKLILNIVLPPYESSCYSLKTYKITPRSQNAHAYVNAGFLFKLDKENEFNVLAKPSIVFGGIQPQFVHATETEEFLVGKPLLSNDTLRAALDVLERELCPDHVLPDASPEYRKGLALSLMYKFILSIDPDRLSDNIRSGGLSLDRPLSSGVQDVDTDSRIWPINKPVPKIEGLMQVAGEAEYTNDMPKMPDEVWAQLVLCDRAAGVIKNVDTSEALKLPGVVAFFGAEDIPGENVYRPVPGDIQDKIFAEGKTGYAGQAIGVIIAETHSVAISATKKVIVNYSNVDTPILDFCEVVDKKLEGRVYEFDKVSPTKKKSNVKFKINGKWILKSQYHFMMETLTCVAVPRETQMDIYASNQHPAGVQSAVSKALNVPAHKINVITKRVGSGYGAKLDRIYHTSAVCAMAAHLLHRPVRMVLNLETNMEWMGKRLPNLCDYEVGVNDAGEIQYLNASIYQDNGHVPSQFIAAHSLKHVGNGYDISTYDVKMYGVITDHAWNTFCRAPGSTEHISMMENIMEHIAKVIDKDPIAVRKVNFERGSALNQIIQEAVDSSGYQDRLKAVEEFNEKNRWKKRGINVSSMSYPYYYRAQFHAHVSIFAEDGTVAISHGGVEMGQGINTKAAQVAAKYLGIDMEMIDVKPLLAYENPNNSRSGGCQATDSVCYAVMMCCEELNRRLAPSRAKLGKSADWVKIVKDADAARVNLRHSYMFTPKDNVKPYDVYGVVVTEVEVDVLTGQFQVLRVDLFEDVGQSISPEIDIGQVEGSFVMGLGYYTSEEMVYNKETGALLSNRSWTYKPPGAKDIPADFRVTFRKNAFNTDGVLGSKATGEPALCLSCSVVFALRNAVMAARRDSGISETWFDMNPPCTVEKVWLACQNTASAYVI